MHRSSTALAVLAGAALTVTTAGAAVGQDESPPPDASTAPEASPEAAVVEPSTLEIIDVAADKTAYLPLKGKKLKKAVAKAAPAAARFAIDSAGDDAVGRIIWLSLAARAADEAGDPKTAKALIDVAKLLYRNEWTTTKSDPVTLNQAIQDVITTDHQEGDPALIPLALWQYGFMDMCIDLVMEDIPSGITNPTPDDPWFCEDEGGRRVRTDATGTDPNSPSEADLDLVDVGGVGIHLVVQDGTANDKLAGKKSKKAWAKALKKHGPTIASLSVGGPDATAEQQVIEYVLLAREADEAGDPKAAKAFMQLALATYRSVVPKPAGGSINTEALNYGMAALIDSDYADTPGLQLMTPPDLISVCYRPKDSECLQNAGDHTPWECAEVGAVLTRMTYEEALAADCDEVE